MAVMVKEKVQLDLTPGENRHFQALERRIEHGLTTFREVGEALLEIRDKRLFRMDYPSFEGYCRGRWELDRNRAYQLMSAAEVVQAFSPNDGGPRNEAQARELVPIYHTDPKLVSKVWEQVKASGEPPTAPRIREAVRIVTGKPATPQPTRTQRLVSSIERVTVLFDEWADLKPSRTDKATVKAALATLITKAQHASTAPTRS